MTQRFLAIWMVAGLTGTSFGAPKSDRLHKKLETLSKVLSYVESNYIEEVNSEEVLDNAIKGLLTSLDPHTLYMPPEAFRDMRDDTKGEFGGLGIEISVKDDQLTIIAPIEDTPADRAGIKPGDKVVKIDGTGTRGMTLLDAIKRLRGPKGSSVVLTIQREGTPAPFDVKLTREKIQVKSVFSELIQNAYGYLRVNSFQERTARDVERHLTDLEKKGGGSLKGLILDMRNNPGGLLDQAVRVADTFLDSGVIVSTIGRKGSFQEVEMAHREGKRGPVPMIVLVNEGSASASEIVAGALQDHGRAIILGAQTFGKGSVQTIIDLGDGSGLKLTIARYYTPKGRSIQALGISPDIGVAAAPPEKSKDDEAIVREKDLKGHFEPTKEKPKETKNEKGLIDLKYDFQLVRALEHLKTWEVFRMTVATPTPKTS